MTDALPHILSTEDILLLNEERLRFIRIAQRYVGKKDIAEDLYQDCIIKTLNHRKELEITDIRCYFLTVIKNRCLDYLKSRLHKDDVPAEQKNLLVEDMKLLTESSDDDFSIHVDYPVLLEKVRENLPSMTYEIFTAKRLSGMSAKEIAAKFNVTERRVNFEIQRASKVFRKVFQDYFILFILTVMNS